MICTGPAVQQQHEDAGPDREHSDSKGLRLLEAGWQHGKVAAAKACEFVQSGRQHLPVPHLHFSWRRWPKSDLSKQVSSCSFSC